jgi:hypothetical protein
VSLRAIQENTGWEAALEIAIEWDKNVSRLIDAVLRSDFATAQLLAEELRDDEEVLGTLEGIDRRAGH